MKPKLGEFKPVLIYLYYVGLILVLYKLSYSYSGFISRNSNLNQNFDNYFFVSDKILNKTKEIDNIAHNQSNIHKFGINSASNEVHCGEILSGTPIKRNEDCSILVDVGLSQPLLASKSSLYFMNDDEHHRLNSLLNKHTKHDQHNSLNSIIYDTIHQAKKIVPRKNLTNFKPLYFYPNDYLNRMKKIEERVPFDVGVGSEIRPQDYSLPLEPKTPEYLKNMDKMEFVVTDISPYSTYIHGDFFSVNIVESKRRIYSLLYLDSITKGLIFSSYDAVIREIMGDVVKLQIINGKHSHMYGINAYAMAKSTDKVGDKIKVYLAGSDWALEQVYMFRTQVSHIMLKREKLKILYDSILKYYINSGKWYKANVEKIGTDHLTLRLFGQAKDKYCGFILKDHLPYNYPEDLLNEAFIHGNNPNDYFKHKDGEISIGKMNYIYHYDSSLYVRVNELSMMAERYTLSTIPEINNDSMILTLTTKNYYKPDDKMANYFIKMLNQDPSLIDIKPEMSYPCIVIGNEGGFIYFAINHTFKENFSLDDDYYIGVMEAGPFSTNVKIGTTVHARFEVVANYSRYGIYGRDNWWRKLELRTFPFLEWLNNLSPEEIVKYKLNNKKDFSLIMMSNHSLPNLKSPQFNELLVIQPVIADIDYINQYEEDELMKDLLNEPDTQSLMGPEESESTSAEKKFKSFYDSSAVEDYLIKESDPIVAPPMYYTHNEELRRIYLRDNLSRSKYGRIMRNITSSKHNPHILLREFFINIKQKPYWEFLETLKNPILRRNITPKQATDFERSILRLLSVIHKIHLESIYEMLPKEDIMFSTIVPKSINNTYYSVDEMKEFYEIVRKDFVMNRAVSRSILNVLKILINPNYSFMALMRARHRNMDSDVFFYSSKWLNYDTFRSLSRPHISRSDQDHDLAITQKDDEISKTSMKPIQEIIYNPNSLTNELEVHGLSKIRKLYSALITMNKPYKSKYIQPADVHEGTEDYIPSFDSGEFDEKDVDMAFDDIDINEYALNTLDGSKDSLKQLSKAWKRLNRFPTTLTKRDFLEYLEDIQKANRVHGIKLPLV